MVSVTVRPSLLTVSSAVFVPSPAGSRVPSQLPLEPLQQVAPDMQFWLAEHVEPKPPRQVGAELLHAPLAPQVNVGVVPPVDRL
jgi:hypothetical protein